MRLIISENQKEKVNNLIYQIIDGIFDEDGITSVDIGDIIEVMSPEDETIFRVYLPKYWSDETREGIELKKLSPILQLENEYEDKLYSLFGSLWHDQMIKWVENNFPYLPKINSVGF
jgi:hypothetical protein